MIYLLAVFVINQKHSYNNDLLSEMSIAAEELPLPRRGVRKKSYRAAMVYKKKLPRRCRDATAYKKILPRRDGL